jgi:type I restriction enzyme M protein
LTQQEAELRPRGASNSLSGTVDAADAKTYVFPTLFWKWISDPWDHEYATAVADFGDDLDPEAEADCQRSALPNGMHGWARSPP